MVEVKIIVLRVINFWNFIGGNLVWLRKRVLIKIMFGNAYQNGHIFEVWDSKGNAPVMKSTLKKTNFISNYSE